MNRHEKRLAKMLENERGNERQLEALATPGSSSSFIANWRKAARESRLRAEAIAWALKQLERRR